MAGLVRNEGKKAKEQIKGGSYIRLTGDLQSNFKDLMRKLDFNPDAPREDAGVKKVGEMVAEMGIELARACLKTGTETLAEYTAHVLANPADFEVEGTEVESEPESEPKTETESKSKK